MYFNRIKKYVETLSYHDQVDTLKVKRALNIDKNDKSLTNFAYLALERLVKLGTIEKYYKTSKRNIYRVIKKLKIMKIAVLKGCRSDTGLITPILKRLKEDEEFFEVDEVHLVPSDYMGSYAKMDWYLKHNTPDLVIIPADRIEMMAGATCCFLYGIPIAHIYGGIINWFSVTVDDTFRHCISLMANIVFCENENATLVVKNTRGVTLMGRIPQIVKEVGNLYMCDYEVDESLVPDVPYNLILYNGYKGSPNLSDKQEIRKHIGKYLIVIGGNPDSSFLPKFDLDRDSDVSYYKDISRPKFLGLLKGCRKFVSNSSACYYEAPTFLKPEQIILIGKRNKARSSLNLPEGKPEIIIETIKNWFGERK